MPAIEDIYDTAFDRGRFRPLLVQLTREFGAQSAFIAWFDARRGAGFEEQVGADPDWLRAYADRYADHDILRPILQAQPEGVPRTVHRDLQRADIRDSIFYREYLAPQRIVDNLAVNLVMRPGFFATLALLRRGDDVAPFDDDEIARLAALVPHLTRALLIQSRLISASNTAEGLRQSAAGRREHVLLLDDAGTILDLDAELASLTGARAGLPLPPGAFARAVAQVCGGQDAALVTVAGAGTDGGDVLLLCEAQALPRDTMADLLGGPAAARAIHVAIVDRPRAIAFGAMAAHFGLTPAESRVLVAALDLGDAASIARHLSVAPATVRTHLHRIYGKTGTGGLVDLCRFAHRFVRTRTDDGPPARR